ncbi:3-keto-5-aminohexanoate cleavage protein [Moorella sulfitireducens]|uniref:3-keto-5-aminohexanoate cleavage protein n=1 Tax=Neomoorella sulfitireducens TaxID=2972948 RepID=UPI0021ABA888|nr:3-keto-5-aminohexanoate cleavage protein [Moorella sulfitireducens]
MITLPQDKVIITVSVTGAMVTKAMTPAVPEQPDEIAQAAYECYNEGAAIVHIHARDRQGKPTGDPAVYGEIHEKIRARCDLILQDSTGGGANLSLEERVKCLEARPEMASLNMGTLLRVSGAYAGTTFSNSPSDIEAWARAMKEREIKPEMEVYSHSMFRDVQNLIDKNLIEKPFYINLVMGMKYQGAVEATPKYLMSLIDFAPAEAIINVSAVGAAQLPLTTMAMVLGCCIRVGLEDNIYYRKGELAKSNAQLVARSVRIARELGKEPATPEEARKILGLKPLKS